MMLSARPRGVSEVMRVPQASEMDGLFHGDSENNMDDLGVPLFQEATWRLNRD